MEVQSQYEKDLAAGVCCSWCGAFFIDETLAPGLHPRHGYPAVCQGCVWNWQRPRWSMQKVENKLRKRGLRRAKYSTI